MYCTIHHTTHTQRHIKLRGIRQIAHTLARLGDAVIETPTGVQFFLCDHIMQAASPGMMPREVLRLPTHAVQTYYRRGTRDVTTRGQA